MMKKLILILMIALLAMPMEASVKLKLATLNVMSEESGKGYLPWVSRSTPMCLMFHKLKADIVAFQEADSIQCVDLRQGLPEYTIVEEKPSTGVNHTELNPMLYNGKVLRLVDRGTFWLSETPDVPSYSKDTQVVSTVCWAMFQYIKTGESFLVANTHFNKLAPHYKSEAAYLLKTYLSKMTNKTPVILVGDFEATENDNLYHVLQSRFLSMEDSWKIAKKQSGELATMNMLGDENANQITTDFIFTSPDFITKSSRIISTKQGELFLSDHNILLSELILK